MAEMYQAFINGQWAEAAEGKTMSIVNPATGQVVAQAARCSFRDLVSVLPAIQPPESAL